MPMAFISFGLYVLEAAVFLMASFTFSHQLFRRLLGPARLLRYNWSFLFGMVRCGNAGSRLRIYHRHFYRRRTDIYTKQ
jgi:hypothetical protein